ncbi:MAG: hypothetical protein M0Q46_01090 [Endomicrobiales bacterium]|nr:hypothetical protein [Endomicrobiales bacterium]
MVKITETENICKILNNHYTEMKKFEKIYFISYMSLTKKLNEDFYLNELKEEGFDVKYLDITKIFFKDFKIADTLNADYILKFDNYKDLKVFLKNNSDALYFILITYELKVFKLHRLFRKYNLKTAFFARYGLPIYGDLCFSEKISNVCKNPLKILFFFKNRFISLVPKIAKKLGYTRNYDIVFTTGELVKNNFKDKVKQIVEVNFSDYDKYLELKVKQNDRLIDKKYCVFLDEYLPYHPDLKMFNIPAVNADNYYKSMNNFFDLIEKKFNVEVVIASHPKSDYLENPFNKRKIFKNKTAELIKYSEFVFAHMSTSVCFSVFFRKPIFFLYTNEYKQIYKDNYLPFIFKMAATLGRKVFNINEIDNNFCFDNFDMSVNEDLYLKYINDYFTTPKSNNLLSKDIVVKFLRGNIN